MTNHSGKLSVGLPKKVASLSECKHLPNANGERGLLWLIAPLTRYLKQAGNWLSYKKRRPLLVEILRHDNDVTLCRVKHNNHWFDVALNRKSIESECLQPGDRFEWIPRKDGIVNKRDIRRHPRVFDPAETKRLKRQLRRIDLSQ
jgi:hypothetical protein